MNTDNIFGKRLTSARKMAGLSLQALADKLGNVITKQSLNKYEQGIMKPDSTILIALANILNVSVDFFFYEPLDNLTLDNVRFRKFSTKINKTQSCSIEEKAKEAIARRLRIFNLLGNKNEVTQFNFGEVTSANIEEAAMSFRHQWELGNDPINDVITMLEDHGYWIIEIEAPDGFDGFHTRILNYEIIVLRKIAPNEDQVRRRISALHEFAHSVLKFGKEISEKEEEKLCTAFASAVLYPYNLVIKEMNAGKFHFYTQELYLLKEKWGISIKAIIYRAYSVGILKEFIFKKMMISYQTKFKLGEKKVFPSKEEPTLFAKMIFNAIGMGVLSLTEAAHLLDVSIDEFRNQIDSVA